MFLWLVLCWDMDVLVVGVVLGIDVLVVGVMLGHGCSYSWCCVGSWMSL